MTKRIFILLSCLCAVFGLSAQLTVWPGDADHNGEVNNLDFLQIGLSYNYVGPIRSNANVTWNGQNAQPWNTNNLVNSAYVDANGDGLVNYFYDAFPVYVHYGLTNTNATPINYTTGVAGIDPQLFFNDTISAGIKPNEATSLPLHLGSPALPVDNFYGIAFTVHYDPNVIDPTSTLVDFNQFSWANDDGDFFSATKKVDDSTMDVAWVRTDHNDRDGQGAFANFDFIIIDNISPGYQNTQIIIDSIRAVDKFGNEIILENDTLDIDILPKSLTSQNAPYKAPLLSLYPSPSKGAVYLESDEQVEEVLVFDAFGKMVARFEDGNKQMMLDLFDLSKGIYFARIQTEQNLIQRKISIE